ncbi:MAG: NFACT RNA binding domain-containing protein, partial [Calditerrivibrio sp.]|nr:NFACT RNA binding domain-containing protein [Calditerrivibrio sp.]
LEGFYKKTAEYLDNIYKMNNFDLNRTLVFARNYLEDGFLYLDEGGKAYPFPIYDKIDKIDIRDYRGYRKIKNSDYISRYNRLISNKIRKKTELLEKLKLELEEAKNFGMHYEKADILKNNLHRIDEAVKTGIFYKYKDDGVEEVKLSIKVENLDDYIKKLYNLSRKLERSIPMLEKRIKEIEGELLFFNNLKFYLENKELSEKEIRRALFKNVDPKINQPAKKVKRYLIYKNGNATIYVGKNSVGNDEILKISAPEDLWFHVKDLPSSHVILKMDSFFYEDLLIFAAQITAFFSKFSLEEKVLVDYTQRKFVKRVKGTPSGFVIYDNFKTLVVRPASPESLNFIQVDV